MTSFKVKETSSVENSSTKISLFPPPTNRGGILPSRFVVGVDWFQGTFPYSALGAVRALFDGYLSRFGQVERPRHFRYLSSALEWTSGHRLCFDPDQPWFYVESNGSSVAALSESLSLAFLQDLLALGLKLTRVDVFRDDYEKQLHPSVLDGWAEQGLLRRFKVHGYHKTKDGKNHGSTFTAGRRGDSGSGLYVRYYDKSQHPTDVADCYRLELEFSGSKAVKVGQLLLSLANSDIKSNADALSGLCVGALDFTDRPIKVRLSRCERSPEWDAYCESRAGNRICHIPRIKGISRSVKAFCQQWGGFCANLSALGLPTLMGVLRCAVAHGRNSGFECRSSTGQGRFSRVFRLSSESGQLFEELRPFVLSESHLAPLREFVQGAFDFEFA